MCAASFVLIFKKVNGRQIGLGSDWQAFQYYTPLILIIVG